MSERKEPEVIEPEVTDTTASPLRQEELFVYEPYEDPILKIARRWKREGRKRREVEALPPDKVACTQCPQAMWMWVTKTDPASRNAMPGFEHKSGWRCHCLELRRPTYDEYASSTDPDAWVLACTRRAVQLKEHRAAAEAEWARSRAAGL